MRRIKSCLIKLIVVYLIIYVALSSLSQCLATNYNSACGEYVSEYAREFIETYCTPTNEKTRYSLVGHAQWSGGSFGSGTFIACCNTGVRYMYELALGIELMDYGMVNYCATDVTGLGNSPYWIDVTNETLQPGDLVISSSHVEMYIGDNQNANFGNDPYSGKIVNGPRLGSDFSKAYRLSSSVQVYPTGTITSTSSSSYDEEQDSIYGSNGFIYQGVATLSGYQSGGTLGKWLFDTLLDILDWVIGLMTYVIRIVIVGWTTIIERFVMDGLVNWITGINNTTDTDEDDEESSDTTASVAETTTVSAATRTGSGHTISDGDDDSTDDGDDDEVSEGVEAVASIGNKAQLSTSSESNITVENIVFNRVPILDANFFNFETAKTVENNEGTAVDAITTVVGVVTDNSQIIGNSGEGLQVVTVNLDKNGIVYILKVTIATWYYSFRILAIAAMLVVLIYLGIRMAVTTVAEAKAVYKEMLLGWVAGFILIFVMHYIMYAALIVNEGIVNMLAGTQTDGSGHEISLYETVRSKAYEIKASSGWSGTIMYIILVFYAIKFLIIYFKRYFTIAVLAILSPLVALSYAIEKVNKKGKRATVYGMWIKDFTQTVFLQSIHALIYVVFIGTALKLTESSLTGIALSLVFLHFMSEAEKILRKIINFSGQGPKDIMKDMKMPKLENLVVGGKAGKMIANAYYKELLGKRVLKPVTNTLATGASKLGEGIRDLTRGDTDEEVLTDVDEKQREAEQKEKEARKAAVKNAAMATFSAVGAVGAATVAIPLAVVIKPKVGMTVLAKAGDLAISSKKGFDSLAGPKSKKVKNKAARSNKTKYRFNGIRVADETSAQTLISNLERDGIDYTIDDRSTDRIIWKRNSRNYRYKNKWHK